jgi:acyl-CoA thioester hydrolase
MDFAAPIDSHRGTVRPEWIDYNGHMNVAYYVLAFDHATDDLFDALGLGVAYREAADHSTFSLQIQVTYLRELQLGAPIRVTTQLLDHDAKRLHYFHEMYHAEEGYRAATCECLSIHVDLTARRSAPLPADIQARLAALMAAHADLPRPSEVGRTIAIRRSNP